MCFFNILRFCHTLCVNLVLNRWILADASLFSFALCGLKNL